MNSIRIAILDMYDNFPNEGMRCIRQLLQRSETENEAIFQIDTYNVRAENAVPDLSYDIYISTGGPGSPLATTEIWEERYFRFVDDLLAYNKSQKVKKQLLLICHSFQLVSRHLGLGLISKRKSTSFGVLPVHQTRAGKKEPVFKNLPNPFFAVDSRDYQLTHLNLSRLDEVGAKVLCLEKIRWHIPLARAIMAIRFTPEVIGTQFHPEADGEGMLRYLLNNEEKKAQVIATHGQAKYDQMVQLLADPTTIEHTESVIIPTFLRRAIAQLNPRVRELAEV